jgi:hypothetical protein
MIAAAVAAAAAAAGRRTRQRQQLRLLRQRMSDLSMLCRGVCKFLFPIGSSLHALSLLLGAACNFESLN